MPRWPDEPGALCVAGQLCAGPVSLGWCRGHHQAPGLLATAGARAGGCGWLFLTLVLSPAFVAVTWASSLLLRSSVAFKQSPWRTCQVRGSVKGWRVGRAERRAVGDVLPALGTGGSLCPEGAAQRRGRGGLGPARGCDGREVPLLGPGLLSCIFQRKQET